MSPRPASPLASRRANIDSWIGEILRPWLRVTGAHLASHRYFFGARPSLADFAFFGGNAAHFINDPLCRRWVDADAPAIVAHTHRIMEPEDQDIRRLDRVGRGARDVDRDPCRAWAVLPAVGEPRRGGWESGTCIRERPARRNRRSRRFSPKRARLCLLATSSFAAMHSTQFSSARESVRTSPTTSIRAGKVPSYEKPPRPALNRPFGPPWERERAVQ